MATLNVSLVSPDRQVWEGEATVVIARTVDGDIGVMAGHEPMLAMLSVGVLRIDQVEGGPLLLAVKGGFLSVDSNKVKILVESAELAGEIDVAEVQRIRDNLAAGGETEAEDLAHVRWAEVRAEAAMRHEKLLAH